MGSSHAGLSVAPDGEHVAFVQRRMRIEQNDYQHDVVLVETATGRASILADAGDILIDHQDGAFNGAPAVRHALFSPDGVWIAFLRVDARSVELWRVRRVGGRAQRIASGPGDIANFAWNGPSLVYETNTPRSTLAAREAQALARGFRVDERFDPTRGIRPAPDVHTGRQVWTWRNGLSRKASDAEAQFLHDSMGKRETSDTSGRRLWVDRYDPSDPAHRPVRGLFYAAGGADRAMRCEHTLCRGGIERAFSLEGHIYFLRNEGFARSDMALYQWSPETQDIRLVRREQDLLVDCQAARRYFYCFQESALQPRRLVRIEAESGSMEVAYDPNPHWRHFVQPRIERIDVHDQYGNPSFAHLVYPRDYAPTQRYPVVVVQYRARGFLRGGVGGEYPVRAFSDRGYFVLNVERPNLDHLYAHLPQAEAFLLAERDHIEQRAKQSAIEAMLAQLTARPDIDAARIAITGLSDGAETLFWAISHSDLFAVAISSTPPIDPIGWSLGSERNRQRMLAFGLVDDRGGADERWANWWDEMSASHRIDHIRVPVLLQLASDETLRAMPFYAHMRARGRPIEMFLYPEAHHIKHRPQQLFTLQRRNLDWIDFWLKGELHSSLDDPDRTERWRALQASNAGSNAAPSSAQR